MCKAIVTWAGAWLWAGSVLILGAAENSGPAASPQGKPEAKWTPAVEPKPLSENVERGVADGWPPTARRGLGPGRGVGPDGRRQPR